MWDQMTKEEEEALCSFSAPWILPPTLDSSTREEALKEEEEALCSFSAPWNLPPTLDSSMREGALKEEGGARRSFLELNLQLPRCVGIHACCWDLSAMTEFMVRVLDRDHACCWDLSAMTEFMAMVLDRDHACCCVAAG
jgi:hypothetical protein